MKKAILTFVLTTILQLSYAQDKPEMPVSIIVNGALNLTALEKTDYFFSSSANPGFSGGAMIRSDGDLFAVAGLQYVTANPTLTDKGELTSEKVTLQFMQIPLMGGFHIVKSYDSKRTLRTHLGGSFSTLLGVSENSLGIEQGNLKKTGFTVKIGIGADLWMFVADINYNLLLTHLYDLPGYNNKSSLMCWEFSIGVKFDLKKKEDY